MGEKTTISILEGNNFVVSDLRADIDASPTEALGLFAWDTRFLSRWILTLDGQRPNVLSTDDLDYFEVRFFLVPGTGTIYVNAEQSIIRKRLFCLRSRINLAREAKTKNSAFEGYIPPLDLLYLKIVVKINAHQKEKS